MDNRADNLAVATNGPRGLGEDRGPTEIDEQIVEIVSDSGEGAQKCGQAFGTVSAKMGNGAWTVEIIPAEIKPPARSRAGASGIRVRLGSREISNMGNEADMVVAFNEQVLYGRIQQGAYREGTVVLLENKWADDPSPAVQQAYTEALEEFDSRGFVVHELAIEQACLEHTSNPRVGKNMFVLGMLCEIYQRDIAMAMQEIAHAFARKGEAVIESNQALLLAGTAFAREHVDYCYNIPPRELEGEVVVMNGNQAVGLGVMAAGIDLVSMYPITPATSASHYLAGVFNKVGGFVHQAEDEIAAIGFAIGASYAGKTACTITSGPGLALKTEFIGLAVMAEIPLVIVDVQRGGPATGLPTKVEQGDLLAALYGAPGDSPKVILAPATIEECFHFVITARKLAEAFRIPVIVLTDANLGTGVQPVPRPKPTEEWLAPPVDQSPWDENVLAYDWDPTTGISPRPIPGQRGGEYVLTGLAHTKASHVAYDPQANQLGCEMRSRKLAALRKTLKPPEIHGDPDGDLCVVGWGSTLSAIEEAVDRTRAEGHKVSSVHVRFLSPLQPGLRDIFQNFKWVMTVELNYSDPPEGLMMETQPGRPPQLALHLRSRTRRDIDYWSITPGQPLYPKQVYGVIIDRLKKMGLADDEGRPVDAEPKELAMFGLKDDWSMEVLPRYFTLEDYEGGVARWCPGCGDHAVLTAVQRICRDHQLPPEQTVCVSGIGCSSRFPHYMNTYGFHGLHGRALPVACGVKARRPDLDVWVATGDGDCCSIGAAHWIHAIRYNIDMVVMLFDNNIYGLTKAQTSPTSQVGLKTNTHPQGAFLPPLNPTANTLGFTNVSFVAQTVDWNPPHLHATLERAFKHKGLSFVRIMQRCPQYTAAVFEEAQRDPSKVLLLNHENGIAADPVVERLFTNQMTHDPADLNAALSIASRDDVIPIGLLFQDEARLRYETVSSVGIDMTAEQKLEALDKELDRFAL